MIHSLLKKWFVAYPAVDRRVEKRVLAEDEFIIEFQRHEKDEGNAGYSRDISVGGIRFATHVKIKKGEALRLTFHFPKEFPGDKKIKVPAKAVRIYRPEGTRRYRVGCQLFHEGEDTKATLREFISWLEAKAPKAKTKE